MRSVDSALRTKYLTLDSRPKVRAILNKYDLSFSALTMNRKRNTSVDFGDDVVGDGTLDRAMSGKSMVFADSAYQSGTGKILEVWTLAAWGETTSSIKAWYAAASSVSPQSTLYVDFNSGYSLDYYQRIGVYPSTTNDQFYVWFVSGGELRRMTYDAYAATVVSVTDQLTLAGFTAIAIHPVSADRAVIVAQNGYNTWVQAVNWSGTAWGADAAYTVSVNSKTVLGDCTWSDAEYIPGDTWRIVIAMNIAGSLYYSIYMTTAPALSVPREMFPSQEQYGNMKVRLSNLSLINGELWGVTTRMPIAYNDRGRTSFSGEHVALISSVNGKNWRDEAYVTNSPCHGKMHYYGSGTVVVGEATWFTAASIPRLGYSTSTTYTVEQANQVVMDVKGPSSAPQVEISFLDADNSSGVTPTESGLVAIGNEITVELGDMDLATYQKVFTGRIQGYSLRKTHGSAEYVISALGKMSAISGNSSYRPVTAKAYSGPEWEYTKFATETGGERLTVAPKDGRWEVTRGTGGVNQLEVTGAGYAIFPQTLYSPSFVASWTMKPSVVLKGELFVFYFQDENNYWRAGIRDVSGTKKLVIDRYIEGALSEVGSATITGTLDVWYTFYLSVRPDSATLYVKQNTISLDFSSSTASISVNPSATGIQIPDVYQMGLQQLSFSGIEGSYASGTVDEGSWDSIRDEEYTFTESFISNFLSVGGEVSQITGIEAEGEDGHFHTLRVLGYSTPPAEGDTWGAYTSSTKDGSKGYYREVFFCEAVMPWTVDDIVSDLMYLAGCTRKAVFTASSVGGISTASATYRDFDITKNSWSTGAAYMYLWCSSKDTSSGDTGFRGLKLSIDMDSSDRTTLAQVTGGGAVSTTLAAFPHLHGMWASYRDMRIHGDKDLITISACGQFLTAFPMARWQLSPGGYIATAPPDDALSWTTQEMPETLDFIWDANVPAQDAISAILEGRRAKYLEAEDGKIAVSRWENYGGNLAEYGSDIVSAEHESNYESAFSLIEVIGAMPSGFYVRPNVAKKRLAYARMDNPNAWTQEAAMRDAILHGRLIEERLVSSAFSRMTADPAMEIEDYFTIEDEGGTVYVVDSYKLSVSPESSECRIGARTKAATDSTSTWGSDAGGKNYDEGSVYQ
jgi:hypothetical protein